MLGFTAARIVVTCVALSPGRLGVRSADPPDASPATVVPSLLIAPALYHHYLAILVLPFLLAASRFAGTGVWLVVAYLLLWGGNQPALGDLAWSSIGRCQPSVCSRSSPSCCSVQAGTSPRPTSDQGESLANPEERRGENLASSPARS